MIPQALLVAIGALAAAVVKLIKAGEDAALQEEALMEAAEATKRGLDYVRFGRGEP